MDQFFFLYEKNSIKAINYFLWISTIYIQSIRTYFMFCAFPFFSKYKSSCEYNDFDNTCSRKMVHQVKYEQHGKNQILMQEKITINIVGKPE